MNVTLSNGETVVVDDADRDLVMAYRWWPAKKRRTTYAYTQVGRKTIYMHRLIMGEPEGLVVDHVDDNGLNNRRSNLRVATHAQNMARQRSFCAGPGGFRGVYRARSGRFVARVEVGNGKAYHHLGTFDTAEQAARAYNQKASEVFGSFARLNEVA